ncbi:MAG TPA: hypothetical protein VFA43_10690 [Gemmatimonadaceae bacterium]|nr:hypothetical protein [Gemmatimonadaceae bacterium]
MAIEYGPPRRVTEADHYLAEIKANHARIEAAEAALTPEERAEREAKRQRDLDNPFTPEGRARHEAAIEAIIAKEDAKREAAERAEQKERERLQAIEDARDPIGAEARRQLAVEARIKEIRESGRTEEGILESKRRLARTI